MIRFFSTLFFTLFFLLANAQDSLNLKKIGQLRYDSIPFSQKLNDIWGYVDEAGDEYALVGLKNGVSVVGIDSLGTPTEIARISGPSSTWRDIKTFNDHAFIIHDNWGIEDDPTGLLVIDLTEVENGMVTADTFMFDDKLKRSHNIYIDENGIAYLTGSDYLDGTEIHQGGALMLDVNDPKDPKIVGNYGEYYLHDCVTRGDTMWGGAIYEGALVAVDVSDKKNPETIGYVKTPNLFTHNCWFSDDGNYIYTTDEKSDATVASYDVSDVGNIEFLDKIQSFYSKKTIPHNTHFYKGYLVTSYYRDGLQIVDAQYPDNLIDVGHYDTSPDYEGNGFNGAWGAYPYLPSGRILVSDMENGLFVFEPTYKRGSYLEITVVDSVTGQQLIGSEIEFYDKIEIVGVEGVLKTGAGKPGKYMVKANNENYRSKTIEVNLKENEILEVEIPLNLKTISTEELDVADLEIFSIINSNELTIKSKEIVTGGFYIRSFNILGQMLLELDLEILNKENKIQLENTSGTIIVQLTDKNKNLLKQVKLVN